MILNNENYYSNEANKQYMSVSQYKQFRKCEAMAMAEIQGEWKKPKSTALLVGSYVDSWFEGTLAEFRLENPEIFKKDGTLKADYIQADEIIRKLKDDSIFMDYMSGEKQRIFTRELFGVPWKIKIDSLHPDKIVDLKIMASMDRVMGKSFVEHWGYDLQMAVYSYVQGDSLDTYLAVATKQKEMDKEIIHVPEWRREELLDEIERFLPHIIDVKSGKLEPERCGVCEYCRATKKIKEPIDFELVGLSTAERKALFGGLIYDK